MNQQLLESLKALPVLERLQLVEELWDSIAHTQSDFPLTDVQEMELDRRMEALDRGEVRRSSWDEVKAGILAR